MYTSLNDIRSKHPCEEGWRKLLAHLGKTNSDDDPIPLTTILDSNGVDDTIWVLGNVCGEAGINICVVFAIVCAERVLPIFESACPGDNSVRLAIEEAHEFLDGKSPSFDIIKATRSVAMSMTIGGVAEAQAAWAATYAAWTAFYASEYTTRQDVAPGATATYAANSAHQAAAANVPLADERATRDAESKWQASQLRRLIVA